MKRNQYFSTFLATILFLLSGILSAIADPVAAPPVTFPIQGGTFPEGDIYRIDLDHSERRAHWYQVYIQKDGSFFTSGWIQVTEDGTQSFDQFPGSLPPGDYSVYTQGWEPCEGAGPFSASPHTFTVTCNTLAPPDQSYPTTSENFDGTWPDGYAWGGNNSSATWGQIEVQKGGIPIGSQWVQYQFPGAQGLSAFEITGFDPAFLDGSYTWTVREYSPCDGIGPPSTPRPFSVSNTDCQAPPEPATATVDMTHNATNTPGASNQPVIFTTPPASGAPASWTHVYIASATTGAFAYSEWVHFSQTLGGVLASFLVADTYYVYTRGYNRCGYGQWTLENPTMPAMAVVTPKDGAPISNLGVSSYDCDGTAFTTFDAQTGVDWYEFYAACDGRTVSSGWTNVNDFYGPGGPINPTVFPGINPGTIDAYPGPCGGRPDIWVRAYGNGPNAMGPWTQLQEGNAPPPSEAFNPAAPDSLDENVNRGGDTTLTWAPQSPRGSCEIYVQRFGQFYTSGYAFCSDPGDPSPTQWHAPFNFCPGEYTYYVRQFVGAPGSGPVGAWSEARTFEISALPERVYEFSEHIDTVDNEPEITLTCNDGMMPIEASLFCEQAVVGPDGSEFLDVIFYPSQGYLSIDGELMSNVRYEGNGIYSFSKQGSYLEYIEEADSPEGYFCGTTVMYWHGENYSCTGTVNLNTGEILISENDHDYTAWNLDTRTVSCRKTVTITGTPAPPI